MRKLSAKTNFFVEQGENATNPEGTISGNNDGSNYSEDEGKMVWMRETGIRLFMQMEPRAYRDEFDWLLRCHKCAVNNCSEEYRPPMPLPLLSDDAKNW